MTNRKRWSRATVAVVFSVMTILGATACYAWIQQERATNEARRAYAVAQNYTAQSNGSGLSLQNAPAQANNLFPNTPISIARTVRYSLPMEQHRLVSLIRSNPKEGNTEKKTEARNQLMRLVEQELVGRSVSQEAELHLLEKRITEAKEKLAQRVARKNEIVERRMAELLSEPDDLAWNADINVPNANDPQLSPLLSLPAQPSSSLQPSNAPPPIQSEQQNANPAVGPAASPGSGTPLNFSVPMFNPPSETIPPASATEPNLPSEEPAPAAKTPNNFASLMEEAIDLESEFEELDDLTPEAKVEAVQRLTLRKRIRKLELGLNAAVKRSESDVRLLSSSREIAMKELAYSEQECLKAKELYNKGALASSEVMAKELDLERAKHKVMMLERDIGAKLYDEKSVLDSIDTLHKKTDAILRDPKPAPEVNY